MANVPLGHLKGDDVPPDAWRRSSYCANSGCVDVASVGEQIAVRDSKDPAGPVLLYRRDEFRAFVEGVKSGEFDDLLG